MSPEGSKSADVRCFYRLPRCRQLTFHYLEGGRQRLCRWFCGVVDGRLGLSLGCRAPFGLEAGEESGPEWHCLRRASGPAKGSAACRQMLAFFFKVLESTRIVLTPHCVTDFRDIGS